jgi:NAD(P)-dependent dehydrogenase (short-subunit alcohol dehydrogenase family)
VPSARVEVASLDLSDLTSVREFAAEHSRERVDVLVNNAGVMAIPRRETVDGFETQFATNHLGHYALTGLLLPSLLQDRGARVVTVSSFMHRLGAIDFADLMGESRYDPWKAYSQSKLANLLFMRELDRRFRAAGLVSVAAHPGYSSTNLQRVGPRMTGNRISATVAHALTAVVGQSAATGALPQLYAATEPTVRGGDYVGPRGPGQLRGRPRLVGMNAKARDDAVAARLWEVSEQLTGVRYPDPTGP